MLLFATTKLNRFKKQTEKSTEKPNTEHHDLEKVLIDFRFAVDALCLLPDRLSSKPVFKTVVQPL